MYYGFLGCTYWYNIYPEYGDSSECLKAIGGENAMQLLLPENYKLLMSVTTQTSVVVTLKLVSWLCMYMHARTQGLTTCDPLPNAE